MRYPKLKAGAAALAVVWLTGCAVSQGDVNRAYDAANSAATTAMNGAPDQVPLVEDVPDAYLGDRLVPLSYDASLPAVFREKTVTFPANLKISQIATLVQSATGYPVHLSPDVFVAPDSLVPRTAAGDTKRGSAAPVLLTATSTKEEPSYTQPCPDCKVGEYLKGVTENLGLDWSFDGTTISISRFVTRMYQIAAIPGKVSIKSNMSKGMNTSTGNQSSGGSSTGSGSDTGSFAAVTSTGREGEFDQIQNIRDELDALKSPMGKVTVNPQSRLVMIYDTREAADRMGDVLKRENAISTRQVMVRVRTIQIALNDGSQAGVNADVVFSRLQGGLARYAISFTSPTSLSSGGGSVGLSVLNPNAPFNGTNAAINALNTYGKTIEDDTQTKLTLNGLPISVATFQSDDYLHSTTPSAGSLTATSGGVPGLTPGTITTGNFLNILPSVNDHNQIILAYWSDTSKLNGPFTSASTGTGQTLQQIQLAHTIGSKDDQTLSLADGQTVVIYGAMTDQNNSTVDLHGILTHDLH